MTRILLALLAFYRRWLSPALHSLGTGGCKYLPTCSEYAIVAISTHGPFRGSGLALWRLLRCHPFARGGLDLVPPAPGNKDRFPAAAAPLAPAQTARSREAFSSATDASPTPFHHEPLP